MTEKQLFHKNSKRKENAISSYTGVKAVHSRLYSWKIFPMFTIVYNRTEKWGQYSIAKSILNFCVVFTYKYSFMWCRLLLRNFIRSIGKSYRTIRFTFTYFT